MTRLRCHRGKPPALALYPTRDLADPRPPCRVCPDGAIDLHAARQQHGRLQVDRGRRAAHERRSGTWW